MPDIPRPNPPRSILIAGATRGIGHAAARILAERGWTVFATHRRPEDAGRLAALPGVTPVAMDYARPETVTAAVETVLTATRGRLGALYNNGAYALPGALEDVTPDALRAMFETNVIGWHDLTRRVVPAMRAQGAGRIVFCSSVLGLVALPWRGAYTATKFAIEGLADTWRLELARDGIAVATIRPGPIATDFVARSLVRFGEEIDAGASPHAGEYRRRLADPAAQRPSPFALPPEAVVAALVHACEAARPKAHYRITRLTLAADIARRLLPAALLDRLARRAADAEISAGR